MNKIEEAIEGHWGERCSETMEGCPCCEAWHQYDMMKWRSERPEPLGKWPEDIGAEYMGLEDDNPNAGSPA